MARATGRAHGVGSGENAHAWVDGLVRLLDAAELDKPLVLRVARAPHAASKRLMAALGVLVEVVPVSSVAVNGMTRCPNAGCDWSFGGTARRGATFLERHLATAHAPGGPVERVPLRVVDPPPVADDRAGRAPAQVRSRSPRAAWSRDRAIAAIQKHAAETGAPPKSTDWQRADPERKRPTADQVKGLFGLWANAIEEAGFPRPTRGGNRKTGSGRAAVGDQAVTSDAEINGEDDRDGTDDRRLVQPPLPEQDGPGEREPQHATRPAPSEPPIEDEEPEAVSNDEAAHASAVNENANNLRLEIREPTQDETRRSALANVLTQLGAQIPRGAWEWGSLALILDGLASECRQEATRA